jgi:hypothetical protein
MTKEGPAFYPQDNTNDQFSISQVFSGPSHSHLSSPPSTQPSMLELENVSEQSHPKDIEDENDVTN